MEVNKLELLKSISKIIFKGKQDIYIVVVNILIKN